MSRVKSLEQIKEEEDAMGTSELRTLHKYRKPYERYSRKSEKVKVIPVEIEMPWEMYELINVQFYIIIGP